SVTACFVIDSPALHPPLHSFPTRRSSDLHTVEGHRPAVAVTHPSGCQYCSHGSYRAPSADVWVVTSRHPAEMTNVNRGPPAVRVYGLSSCGECHGKAPHGSRRERGGHDRRPPLGHRGGQECLYRRRCRERQSEDEQGKAGGRPRSRDTSWHEHRPPCC